MSASTELLLEQIKQAEDAIRMATEAGHDTSIPRASLKRLHEQLAKANQALNEGTQKILKG